MRAGAGRRQRRSAEGPAKRATGDAIVPDGWKAGAATGGWELSEVPLKWKRQDSPQMGQLELDDAFDFLRWRLFAAFAALELYEAFTSVKSSCENRKTTITMAREPISPEEARRRKV